MLRNLNNSVKKPQLWPPKDQFWSMTPSQRPALDLPLVVRKSFEQLEHSRTVYSLFTNSGEIGSFAVKMSSMVENELT